jgi:hypothetical protein
MTNTKHNRLPLLSTLVASCALLLSCSKQPGTINRVQANLVDKAIFEGEWWYSSTSIDVSYDEASIFQSSGAAAPFEGSMSTDYAIDFNRSGPDVLGSPSYSFPIARIRWVIDENYLFAYRSFELVSGGNKDGRSPDYRGQPLAVFKIEAHVDVRKDYSSLTGEKTNVIIENTTDRRWYDRTYMRVDWSQNLITDFAANDAQSNELFTTFKREPTPFFIQDGTKGYPDSYKPQFIRVSQDPKYRFAAEWPKSEADKVHYMSFVTKEVWSPGKGCVNGGGTCAAAAVTMRNSFLRVPPDHEYALATMSNAEFDRFGIFRSHQVTYTRGGEDRAVQHKFCAQDADCGPGGACDVDNNYCVGGLTSDRGETDFLSFYMSRHNMYAHSLDKKQSCVEDWECDGRHLSCDQSDDKARSDCEKGLLKKQGSVCDQAAKVCTIPLRDRPTRNVEYRLSPHFPPYLVRQAFEAVAQWNEALMRGQRAVKGVLPIDQMECDSATEKQSEDPTQRQGDGLCTVNLSNTGDIACQTDNPAAFCYCGSPEEVRGVCHRSYDPFETPAEARDRQVPRPYDCYVAGPKDVARPQDYTDYKPADVYGYHFEGKECMLTLLPNECDVDPKKPCQELGDLRYQFLTLVQHGAVSFGGIAQPLTDPTNGELIVSLASTAAESVESVGTTASQFFPVLRGDEPEDQYFAGENLRGYYARLGRVQQPVAIAPSGSDGYSIGNRSRPASSQVDIFKDLSNRMQNMAPKMQQLYGQDGRTAILSDRLTDLHGSDVAARVDGAIVAETNGAGLAQSNASEVPQTSAQSSKTAGSAAAPKSFIDDSPIDEVLKDRARQQALASRNIDDFEAKLYNAQYWGYWADAFKGRSNAEASLRMQQLYFKAVMTHEVGHAMGLQHNFAGSLDRDNYPDAYYSLARSLPLPAYLDYDDPAKGGNGDGAVAGTEATRWANDLRKARTDRLKRGAGNVMTASVMDYEGDLSNFAGMGRYDAAAVMFEYFGKVEAYAAADPSVYPPGASGTAAQSASSLQGLQYADSYRRELWSYYAGGETCGSDADCPNHAGVETTAYQPITQRCVNNPRVPNTTGNCGSGGCICSNFDDDFRAYLSAVAYRSSTRAPEYAPVTYRYCHDNRINDLSWCTQNDAGESFQEVVDHYRLGWAQRYPQVYFRNYRRGGPTRGYSQSTVVDAVKIYQHLFFRYNFEGATFRNSTGPLGYADQLFASADVLNWLAEIIGMPDVGSYTFDQSNNTYHQTSSDPNLQGAELSLAPGQGFYLWSAYQDGQNGFSRLERAGTFLDKLMAIEALARRDWGLSYTIDERYYINFYDLFDKEVIDLFGGMILRNPKAYAPRVAFDAQGQPIMQYMSLYRSGDRGSNEQTFTGPAVDGTDSEVLRDAATIQALATFPIFYDTSFEQRLLIFKTGSGDGYQIPATRQDGSATCAYGDAGCADPDYIVYDSDRLHTSFVAVVIRPNGEKVIDEQQLAFQLLLKVKQEQQAIRDLQAKPSLGDDEQANLTTRRLGLERDETFINYLIELERSYGISSYLTTR